MTSIAGGRDNTKPTGGGGQPAGWKTGTALASIAGIASLQRSLLPRSTTQQAIVTAGSMALAYGVGVGANAISNRVDDATGLDAVGSRLAVGTAGTIGAIGMTLALRGRPNLAIETTRTTAGVLGAGAIVGATLIGEQALADRFEGSVPGGATGAHAAILGAAAIGTGALLLGRARSTGVSAEAEAAYLASVGGAQGSAKPLAWDGAHFERLTQLRNEMTTVSGRTAGTLLPDGAVGTSGFRFINEATPGAEIARVMGVDAAKVKDPIRVYGGMDHAATRDELAQKIFDEALAKGAFDRSHVALYLPSGTGHVNPMPVAAMEYLTHGDVASIGMQYYNKPSIQSFHKVGTATELFEAVLRRFTDHVETLPADRRPALTAYGESLGAWAMQDSFLASGPSGVAARGLDRMISVGTPRFSKLRTEAIGAGGHRIDASGTMFEFNDPEQLRGLTAAERDGILTFLLTHRNDPVNKFSPRMFVQRPEWLSSSEHATGVPRKLKWVPGVSGLQGAIDNVNGAKVVPGILERTGHDYRADMAPLMAEVLGASPSKQQMDGITEALTQIELSRVHGTLPEVRFPVAPAAAPAG